MNEETEKIIDRAEEVFKDAVYGDIEITKNISSYITWITALATCSGLIKPDSFLDDIISIYRS